MTVLDVRGLTVTYGVVSANLDIDLAVDAGTVVGLIGPNGAGKTTFIDAITGFAGVSAGVVRFGGNDVTSERPAARARRGLVRTFQSLELFEDLTVLDNVLVAASPSRWYSMLIDVVWPQRNAQRGVADAQWALEVVGLGEYAERTPSELSHGQRKLVGVARAVAMRPQLLLLDEPAAGLDTGETLALGERIRGLLQHGMAVLLVDHDMNLVSQVCDRVYALDLGSVIANGTPTEVLRHPAVVAAYLGSASGGAHG